MRISPARSLLAGHRNGSGVELWLFDLHHHLWMGEPGATTGGILGLIGIGFTITGLLLWWRARRSFALRLLPEGMSRSQIVRHHRDLGDAHVAVAHRDAADRSNADAATGCRFPALAAVAARHDRRNRWHRRKTKGGAMSCELRLAHDAADSEAQVPSGRAARHQHSDRQRAGSFAFVPASRTSGCPNGRTLFWVDPADGRFVDVVDARSLPLAARAFNIVYPVHASTVGGFIYKAAMTIAGLALTLLGTLAVYGFWRHRVNATASATTTPYRARSGSR